MTQAMILLAAMGLLYLAVYPAIDGNPRTMAPVTIDPDFNNTHFFDVLGP
jgi:hypothetical protein